MAADSPVSIKLESCITWSRSKSEGGEKKETYVGGIGRLSPEKNSNDLQRTKKIELKNLKNCCAKIFGAKNAFCKKWKSFYWFRFCNLSFCTFICRECINRYPWNFAVLQSYETYSH